VAYPALFLLLSGDGIRYLVGWYGYGALAAVLLLAAIGFIFVSKDRSTLKRFPIALAFFLALTLLSGIWSHYPSFSLLAFLVQLATTTAALFFAIQFDWRQLLNIFANTIRLILLISLVMELVAAFTGPIRPIFANFEGDQPPAPAYWWIQGNLFQSERIQGFVGNANLMAFMAVLGLAIFFVEYLVTIRNKKIAIASIAFAAGFIALAKSASMTIALVIVIAAAVIAMISEGRPKSSRHRIYRFTFWAMGFVAFLVLVYWEELTEFLGKSPDASGRFLIWEKVFGLALERPVFGWGWISHWIPGVAPYEGLIVIDDVPHFHAHNAFLDVWLQLGVLGLGIFVWLMWTTFARVWRIAVVHTNPLYLWPLFAFMVIATQSLTESRILVENGWLLLSLIAIKSTEPFDNLEPVGLTPKLKKLFRAASALFRKRTLREV
jgi:exopolysaccharide production protein ExoQ